MGCELRFAGVSVRYGSGRSGLTAIDGVSLVVPPGKVVGLVGESGSGKSTLARAAVGLAPVAAGRVLLDEQDIRDLPPRNRPLQMVFQDPYSSLDPRMTVGASIGEALPRAARRSTSECRREIGRLLDLVHLDPERGDALPGSLSGGQRQRVCIARALAGRPEVLIADELTSALDVSVQGAMLNLIRDIQRSLQLSTLFISHNLAVVRYVSDLIAVMHLGRIVEVGRTEDVLVEPRHPYTRGLLAAAPVRSAPLVAGDLGDSEPPDPQHPPCGCRFHPRCPIGPLRRQDREICLVEDPVVVARSDGRFVACHFAERDAPDVNQIAQ